MRYFFRSRAKNILSRIIKTHPGRYFGIFKKRLLKVVLYSRNNSPYVSGDSIAALTDYYISSRNLKKSLDRERLAACASISIKGEIFHSLLPEIREIPGLRTVVTCNSDENFLEAVDLPKNVTLWLCQNSAITDDVRVHTLPIGIENLRLARSGFPSLHRAQSSFEVNDKVLVPPMSPTNKIRAEVLDNLNPNDSIFEVRTNYLNSREYFRLTRKYQFILALEGNGFENHRIWEALYQNSFPVMFRTKWSLSLAELKLPIMFIDSLSDITPESLENFRDSHKDFAAINHEALWTPYWGQLISTGIFREPNSGYKVY